MLTCLHAYCTMQSIFKILSCLKNKIETKIEEIKNSVNLFSYTTKNASIHLLLLQIKKKYISLNVIPNEILEQSKMYWLFCVIQQPIPNRRNTAQEKRKILIYESVFQTVCICTKTVSVLTLINQRNDSRAQNFYPLYWFKLKLFQRTSIESQWPRLTLAISKSKFSIWNRVTLAIKR